MITKDKLKALLTYFGFSESNGVYKKEYRKGASIEVNPTTQKIIYAPIDEDFSEAEYPSKKKPAKGFVIHRDTTLNFSANENFVCLVCVHLLLEKGYEPKHIVFEPAFQVGHINKPSYGDILVFDKEYAPLVLIENKTFGSEFSGEWNRMQKNGGQLFSYLGPLANKLGFCENLVLFAADFDESLILKSHIITLKDNEKRIKELDNPKTFDRAQGKFFDVWAETYAKSFETKGLFENDILPYTIGKLKYTIDDLNPLSHAEIRPIYHEFATILRNHAITDLEHSFYILIDLFLCKITDELNNPTDLQFYYKGITRDTPKEYCARLLDLYQLGKKQLFDVDVINKNEADIRKIFDDTNRIVTNGLYAGIKELFEEIKFYNIKKFNFIEVENKEEFEMNFQILIKIAALIQDINLSSSETNHFFGDLFEGLLSKNVHQTEGQFFTPLPIVNFIIKSLPEFPNSSNVKVLDYACGAGHFLTEFVKSYSHVQAYGIEKSQPLSQVAKIATIINGAKNSRIVFKDSLSVLNTRDVRFQGFDKESFDCVIANPPYSVKGFLNTITDVDRLQFDLVRNVEEKTYSTNRAIECFFVERAKYFLKPNGFMGIVLPSSILTNGNLFKTTRELLFANFNILAIVNLGSRTFGSTGTNTIVLFAQRVKKNSEGLLHTFIEKKDYTQYSSYKSIDSYIQKQGYEKTDFFSFMQEEVLSNTLEGHEIFAEYRRKFKTKPITKTTQKEWFKTSTLFNASLKDNSKEYRKLFTEYLNTEEYNELSEAEYRRQFVLFAKRIEEDKLNTFIQTESNYVAILQSPPDKIGEKSNKAQVIKFLGYDWSNRKGDEGIKYITNRTAVESDDMGDDKDSEVLEAINSIKYIQTPLYNPDDVNDSTKYAYAIRKHIVDLCDNYPFKGKPNADNLTQPFSGEMGELLSYARLVDMIDFSRTSFDKSIKPNTQSKDKTEIIETKFHLKPVEDILIEVNGKKTKIEQNEIIEHGEYPVITQESGRLISGYTDNPDCLTDLPLIVFGDHSCTFKYVDFPFVRGADGTQLLKTNQNEVLTKYLYYYLSSIRVHNAEKYERHFKYLKTTQIPIPEPIEIQKAIIRECEKVDNDYTKAQEQIVNSRRKITSIIERVNEHRERLGRYAPYGTHRVAFKDIAPGSYITTDNILQNCEGIMPYEGKPIDGNVVLYKKGDILVSNIRPYLKKAWLADKDGGCSPDVLVFRIIDRELLNPDFLYYVLCQDSFFDFMMQGKKGLKMPRGDKNIIPDYMIPVPPITEQQSIVVEISALEAIISEAKTIIADCPIRKKQILDKWLK